MHTRIFMNKNFQTRFRKEVLNDQDSTIWERNIHFIRIKYSINSQDIHLRLFISILIGTFFNIRHKQNVNIQRRSKKIKWDHTFPHSLNWNINEQQLKTNQFYLKKLAIKENTLSLKLWLNPPANIYRKFYMFNVTNPEKVLSGKNKIVQKKEHPYQK